MEVLICSSPLQLINANEAIHHFKIRDYLILIPRVKDRQSNINVDKTIRELRLHKYQYLYCSNYFNLIIKTLLLRKGIRQEIQRIFIGDYESVYFRTIASILSKSNTNIFFLDDGISTILGFQNGFIPTELKTHTAKNKIKHIISKTLFPTSKNFFGYSLFTMFTPNFINNNRIYQNQLECLRNKMIGQPKTSGIYFIGSCLPELGFIHESNYLIKIEEISSKHADDTIYYLPHRKEFKSKLRKIEAIKNISVMENESTIEIYFINNMAYPETVYGFHSTALYTIKMLHDKTKAFAISFEPQIRDEDFLCKLKTIYKFYNDKGIKVIR